MNAEPEMEENAETKRRSDKVADREREIMPGEKRRGWGRLQRGNSSEKSCNPRAEYRRRTLETEAATSATGGSERENRERGINS